MLQDIPKCLSHGLQCNNWLFILADRIASIMPLATTINTKSCTRDAKEYVG